MSIQKSGSEVRSFARWVPGMRYFLLGSATLVRGRPSRAARIYFSQNILCNGSATPMRGKSPTCRKATACFSGLRPELLGRSFGGGHRPPKIGELLNSKSETCRASAWQSQHISSPFCWRVDLAVNRGAGCLGAHLSELGFLFFRQGRHFLRLGHFCGGGNSGRYGKFGPGVFIQAESEQDRSGDNGR